MGYLKNLLRKVSLPEVNLKEIFKTSQMASVYSANNYSKINKLLSKGKSYYKSVKFKENKNYSLLHQSVIDSNLQVVDLILQQKYGKDKDIVEDIDNESGFAPIHLACIQDDIEMVKDLIEKGNCSVTVKSRNDNLNLMHIAAQFGSLKTLKYIHKYHFSSNVDLTNEEKWTPLHFACFMNKFDICSYLIDCGSNIYARNKQYLTPIEISVLNDNFDLFEALYKFHYDIFKLSSFDHQESAKLVHIAASCKKGTKILQYLLEDPNNLHEICNSKIFATPLHFACMQSNINAVKLILRHSPNINISDYLGNTPLHYATEVGSLPIIKILLENDADLNKKNKEGLTPVQLGVLQGNKEIKLFYLGSNKFKAMSFKDLL
jgi:ankyrin repeat protein